MPPENTIATGTAQDWLRYARSDLALASISRPDDVLWEGLCFHAQQATSAGLRQGFCLLALQMHSIMPLPHD